MSCTIHFARATGIAGYRCWRVAADNHTAQAEARRAVELLEPEPALTDALMTVGTAELMAGLPRAGARLEGALELALEAGLEERVVRARTNLGLTALAVRDSELADRQLLACAEYCNERDLGTWPLYIAGWRARSELEQLASMSYDSLLRERG
jgi:hypothetical protein